MKPRTPCFSNAGFASPKSWTKKKTISARISAARAVSPQRSARSGMRASGDRESTPRSPLVAVAASTSLVYRIRGGGVITRSGDRRAVALQRLLRFLGLRQDRRGQLRVVGLRQDRLAGAEPVFDE